MSDWITITVTGTKGSTPRPTGTSMRVFADRIEGSIGGGALEWEAMRLARQMLESGANHQSRALSLGPDMGQCCGGAVTLAFERNAQTRRAGATPLWIWGAGHVGRAIAQTVAPLDDRQITLVDISTGRMPADLHEPVLPLVAADPLRAVPHAPRHADHLIVTHSHDLDLKLCDALLRHGFGSCGLIGSATKWARFRKRLMAMGHAPAQIATITCPIGDPSLGKHPQAIAVGITAALLKQDHSSQAKEIRV